MGRAAVGLKYWLRLPKNQKKGQKNLKKTLPQNWKMQATDGVVLNDDCLLKIFQYLDISDLVNVAVSSKHFKFLARDVFKRTFGKDVVTVTNKGTAAGKLPSLELLRHFGDLITNFVVEYDNRRKRLKYEAAISKYCRRSVVDVEFKNCSDFSFNRIKRPFVAVDKVVLTKCPAARLITKFNELFPKARSLDFLDTSSQLTDCVQQPFPQLEHFGFANPSPGDTYNDVVTTAVRTILMATIKLNPQLNSLTLKCPRKPLTPDDLSCINETLPLLETLDVIIDSSTSGKQIHFQNLRKLTIVSYDTIMLAQFRITTRLPAELTLTSRWLMHHFGGFLVINPNWEKISVHGFWWHIDAFEEFKKEIINLELLTSIEVSGIGLKGRENNVLALLDQCKSLMNFKVYLASYLKEFGDFYFGAMGHHFHNHTFLELFRSEFDLTFNDSPWLPKYEANNKSKGPNSWAEFSVVFEKQASNQQ